jgi:hopanoid biosynthesis associated protein HpnK
VSGRSLIVNADDFGLSPGVNRGIVRAFEEGIVSSTTLLVNQPGFDEAVALAHAHPRIRAGVHLTLLWGAPVSSPATVPSLVEAGGLLPRTAAVLARRYLAGTLDLAEVRAEFQAQIARMKAAGLTPTHADTHKHVHALPGVLGALLEAAGEAGIERVRLPIERPLPRRLFRPSWRSAAKRWLVGALFRNARERVAAAGLRTPDHFLGLSFQDRLNSSVFRSIFPALRGGVTEIMCHPGLLDGPPESRRGSQPRRQRELDAVCDPEVRAALAVQSIRLMSYAEL